MQSIPSSWVVPSWPAPKHVCAVSTSREGGVSQGPYAFLNLSDRVGDDPEAVLENRAALLRYLALPNEPFWLTQVHGRQVIHAGRNTQSRASRCGDC